MEESEERKRFILSEIARYHEQVKPILDACGISRNYQLPEFSPKMRIKRLQATLDAIIAFVDSEAIGIFKAAEALRPPGVLARWAADELLAEAREVKIYRKAINLVRAMWRETVPLPQFFKIRKVSDASG